MIRQADVRLSSRATPQEIAAHVLDCLGRLAARRDIHGGLAQPEVAQTLIEELWRENPPIARVTFRSIQRLHLKLYGQRVVWGGLRRWAGWLWAWLRAAAAFAVEAIQLPQIPVKGRL